MAIDKAMRVRIPAQERREIILRAAGGLFARDGYAAARLEDIAAAAGVTKPIVYRHFESKKALYLALLAKHEDDLPGFFAAADASPGGADPETVVRGAAPETVVRTTLEGWLDYVRENRHAWVMLFRDSSGDAEIRALRRRVSRRARQVIAGFIAERPGAPLPPEQVEPTAELLRSGLAGLALWWIDHPGVPKPVLVEVATRMTEAALTTHAAQDPA
jgi:AcrR family transcriptional regulator